MLPVQLNKLKKNTHEIFGCLLLATGQVDYKSRVQSQDKSMMTLMTLMTLITSQSQSTMKVIGSGIDTVSIESMLLHGKVGYLLVH